MKFIIESAQLITPIIAILGFVLSLYNFISNILAKRKRLKLDIIGFFPEVINVYQIKVIFFNKSQKNILINKAVLIKNKRSFEFKTNSCKINESLSTIDFPFMVMSDNYVKGIIECKTDENFNKFKTGDKFKIELYTSSGKSKFSFRFDKFSDYSELY